MIMVVVGASFDYPFSQLLWVDKAEHAALVLERMWSKFERIL